MQTSKISQINPKKISKSRNFNLVTNQKTISLKSTNKIAQEVFYKAKEVVEIFETKAIVLSCQTTFPDDFLRNMLGRVD